jgi:hypothetical protein
MPQPPPLKSKLRQYHIFSVLGLGQEPAKVVFMNEPSSSLVGYGTAQISAEDRPAHRADINPEYKRFARPSLKKGE